MKTILKASVLFLILALFSCNLSTGDTGDITDVPASGATTVPANADDAKSLYLEVSDALYDEIDPLGENESKSLLSKTAKEIMQINQDLATVTRNGITMKGSVTGTIDSNMPTSPTGGSFSNTIDITVDMDGTMDQFEMTDPQDSTKKYTVSGTIKNKMHTKMSMSMSIDANLVPTPSGTLDMDISLTTNFAVKRSDGTGARFKLVFEDKSPTINLGAMGPGTAGGPMPCGADAYTKEATLYTYDDTGKLVAEAKVPLKDTPWMMSNLMGGGGGGGGGGGTVQDNENQSLIKSLLGALDKAVADVNNTPTYEGNVRVFTFNGYKTTDNITLNGTEKTTFSSLPASPDKITAGATDITFSGTGRTGDPFKFILEMTVTNGTRTYTKCTINGADMLEDYKTMAPSSSAPSGPPSNP